MAKQQEPNPPYKTDVLHVFGAKKFDTEAFWSKVAKRLEDKEFPSNILISTYDPEDGIKAHYELILKGASSQGLEVVVMDDDVVHVELPWLASWGDINLAFAFINVLIDKYKGIEVYLNDNAERPIVINDDNMEAFMSMRDRNMAYLLEFNFENDQTVGIPGCCREYILDALDPNAPDEEYSQAVGDAFQNFVAIQWLFEDCHTSGLANVKSPEGEEFQMRFLANTEDTFVGCCQKLSLTPSDESYVKLVDIQDFCNAMADNKYFIPVDRMQFVMKKMPARSWDKIVREMKGQEYSAK